MITKNRLFIFALLATTILSCAAAAPVPDPAVQRVSRFYSSYRTHSFSGLPDKKELAKIAPYLSTSLLALFRQAQLQQMHCQEKYPDDKPPWAEGDMFSSHFEGTTAFETPSRSIREGAQRAVTMNFSYTGQGETLKWQDRVLVVKEGSQWVIDDVYYLADWNFKNGFGTNLRQALAGSSPCT